MQHIVQFDGRGPSDVQVICSNIDKKIKTIECGNHFVAVCTTEGEVGTFGSGIYGELGQCSCQLLGTGASIGAQRASAPSNVQTEKGDCYIVDAQNVAQRHKCHSTQSGIQWINLPKKIVRVSCGSWHSLCLDDSGSCWGFGNNYDGQLGINRTDIKWTSRPERIPSLEARICHIAAGYKHSLFVTEHGLLYSCGSNRYGQLGIRSPSRNNYFSPQQVLALASHRMQHLSAGAYHNAVLTDAGLVYTFGWGLYYQLGTGTTNDSAIPQLIESLVGVGTMRCDGTFTGIQQVSCGAWHTVALSTTGEIYAWGWNAQNQLSFDTKLYKSQPEPRMVQHGLLEHIDIIQIQCGLSHTSVQCANGKVFTWGSSLPVTPSSFIIDNDAREPLGLPMAVRPSGQTLLAMTSSSLGPKRHDAI